MPRRRTELLSVLSVAALLGACGKPPSDSEPQLTALPQRASARSPALAPGAAAKASAPSTSEQSGAPPTVEALLSAPQGVRWSTPGGLRWRLGLEAAATAIRASSLGGIVVSAGDRLENVTSRGLRRWAHVAGRGHRVFHLGEQEIVWSPAFGKLAALLPRGGEAWSRPWDARVIEGAAGEPLLVDAATVAAVGTSGEDRWRAIVDGLRKLSDPFPCGDGMLFQGSRGLAGVAVTVSARGKVLRETELERGAIVVGASSSCEPLVWNGAEVGLLDARGLYRWRRVYTALPFVGRLSRGFLLASGGPDRPMRIESVNEDGRSPWTLELPLPGRFSRFAALEGAIDGEIIAGLCLNTESACSNPDGDRGPFNAVFRVSAAGAADVLERQLQGHIDMARLSPSGLATASSSGESATEVSLRDGTGSVRAAVTLPGRLSAGPFVGASGEVYVATCDGWKCAPPYSLFAITGIAEPEEVDSP